MESQNYNNEDQLSEFGKCVIRAESLGDILNTEEELNHTNALSNTSTEVDTQSIAEPIKPSSKNGNTSEVQSQFVKEPNIISTDDPPADQVTSKKLSAYLNMIPFPFGNKKQNEETTITIDSTCTLDASSILDEEFEGSDTTLTDDEIIRRQVTKDMKSNVGLSLISKDGDVLSSPASHHLMTQFEKFVIKETIIKQKEEILEGCRTQSSILNVNTETLDSNNVIQTASNDTDDMEVSNTDLNLDPKHMLCLYAAAGCSVILEKESKEAEVHHETCKYRPLKCILAPACNETLDYNRYISHLSNHFLVPVDATDVTTTVILTPHDLVTDQSWAPKWFTAYENHFFAMVTRKKTRVWSCWIWMLGSEEDAGEFSAEITFFKGVNNTSNVFPVHSIRTCQDQIELSKKCFLLTDEAINKLTPIEGNAVTDFNLKVELILNSTMLENKAEELVDLVPSGTTITQDSTMNFDFCDTD